VSTAAQSDRSALARVGSAVAERRLDLGLSQRELADKAGVALNTAALLERGQTFPRAANARKLEAALEWPRGTLQEIRRGSPPPPSPPPASPLRPTQPGQPPAGHPAAASRSAQALAIAGGVVGVAATCMNILVARRDDPASAAALRDLDAKLLQLESLLAAGLPEAESFDDTMAVLTDLHRHRDAIRQAAAQSTAG